MSITYSIAIDRDNDGDFSDTGEAISSDVLRLRWRLGMEQPFDSMAQPTWAEITLRNKGGAFSPERSGMIPGQRIRIQSDDGSTVRAHFTGFISRIDPSTGDQGERTAVITVLGAEERLSVNVVRLKPLENVRADEAISAVLDQCQLRHSVLDGMFILDQQATLGTHQLAGDAIPRQFETGVSTFAYLGETWAEINAETAIRQLTESERGRFYIDREGNAVFLNRHHTLVNTSVTAAFDDDMQGLNYTYGADIRNRVQLQVTPRSIGQADTVLWQLDKGQRIAAGKTQRIAISYHDESGNPVNARDVSFSYVASTSASGGSDASSSAGTVMDFSGADRATFAIKNNSNQPIFLTELTVRGTPIAGANPMILDYADQTSITYYGLCILSLDLPALSSLEEADDIARYELSRRSQPAGLISQLQTSTRTHQSETLALTLFDRVTVSESQTGHSSDYLIVAEEHLVENGGYDHTVTWLLEPADNAHFAIVGSMMLDGEQVLAY